MVRAFVLAVWATTVPQRTAHETADHVATFGTRVWIHALRWIIAWTVFENITPVVVLM
jgi:hypothetical protein